MKALAFSFMLLTSLQTYAIDLDNPTVPDVVRAIKDSLAQNDLNCVEIVKNTSLKASLLRLNNLLNYEMIINEGQQPVITFLSPADSKSTYETTVLVTTTPDYMMVTGIETEQFKVTKTARVENTGTIINPKYETVETVKRELTERVICK